MWIVLFNKAINKTQDFKESSQHQHMAQWLQRHQISTDYMLKTLN